MAAMKSFRKPAARKKSATAPQLPIYVEIQRDVERKITTGEWRPGDRVPAEHELVKIYKCSRMTVNKALSSLAAAGLIVRKRRSGSSVAPPRMEEPLLTIQDIRAEVLSMDRSYRSTITYRAIRVVSDPTDATYVGAPVGTRMLCLELTHFADNLPFALEAREISLAAAPDAEFESFSEVPPGTWLLNNIPWSDGEHSVRAVPADEVMAKRLRIASGAACISVSRRTWRSGDLVTFVRLVYPGERHRFVVRFSPSSMRTAS